MDVAHEQSGGTRRRRRGAGGRRRTARSGVGEQEGGADVTVVEKADGIAAPAPAPAPVGRELASVQSAGARAIPASVPKTPAPIVVLAPAKKKPTKVLLVPKTAGVRPVRLAVKKTFRARKVRVTIDNTAKTHKRRRVVLGKIDDMTDAQVRDAAVRAKLSRAETVAKAPIALLRQMVKDYLTLRGQFL
jgi:hypothetical protein